MTHRPWYSLSPQSLFDMSRVGQALLYGYNEDGVEIDRYGNPVDGSALPYCCFPDCGCDGNRNCMAENGPNFASAWLNPGR
jgi:hypothetical protein